jgi:hypothetical protein
VAPSSPRRRHHITISGDPALFTGEVLVNEAMDNLCRVAEFQIAEQPAVTPEEGDPVVIYLLNLDDEPDTAQYVFGGKINAIEVQSQPWSMVIRCTDQLELLRRVPTADHNLTGMTDGEAVMEVLDGCQIDYDPADIFDYGYVLGAEVPVKWLAGVTGAQVIQEINAVFGTVLLTIGNNRVIRVPIQLPPADATGSYREYERGVSADWAAHGRSHGERDAIQNFWMVRGASIPSGADDECQSQPWANAVHGNPQLGSRRVRVTGQEFQSDLIQDESLAEFVVRMMMRRTNRLQETAVLEELDDPNVHSATLLTLVDNTYGIETGAGRNAVVTSVDRTGHRMTVTCQCGPPGNEGTVTTGVEKVCNDTHTDTDIDLDFDFDVTLPTLPELPDFNFELDLPTFDLDLIGGTDPGESEQVCMDGTITFATAWFNSADNGDGDDWLIAGSDISSSEDQNGTAITVQRIPRKDGMPVSYRITFTAEITTTGGFELYAADNRATFPLHFFMTYFGTAGLPGGIQFQDWGAYEGTTGSGLSFGDAPDGTPVDVVIEWDRVASEFTVTVDGVPDTISPADDGDSQGIYLLAIARGGIGGTQQIDNVDIELLEDGDGCDFDVGDWVEVQPNIAVVDGELGTDSQGGGYYDALIDVDNDWTLRAMITKSGGGDFHFGVASNGTVTGDYEVLVTGSPGDLFYVQTGNDFAYYSDTPFSDDVPMRVTLSWDASLTELSVIITQAGRTEVGSLVDPVAPSGTDFRPFILSDSGSGGVTIHSLEVLT